MKRGMRGASHKDGRLPPLAPAVSSQFSVRASRLETEKWELRNGGTCAQSITASRPRLPYPETVNGRTWKTWLLPGGLLLALATTLVNTSLFVQLPPSLSFFYVALFAAGLLLACRFTFTRLPLSLL